MFEIALRQQSLSDVIVYCKGSYQKRQKLRESFIIFIIFLSCFDKRNLIKKYEHLGEEKNAGLIYKVLKYCFNIFNFKYELWDTNNHIDSRYIKFVLLKQYLPTLTQLALRGGLT